MIEPLPIEFKKNERSFRQLARRGIVALYELRNLKANQAHRLIGFELIIVRLQKAHYRNEILYPEHERYPGNEEFGRYGWSLPSTTRELAELLFDDLATILARNRSECSTNTDYYRAWTERATSHHWRLRVRQWLTGRPLSKTAQISNKTPTATERLTETNGE
jgi:hypothetical protein